MELKYGKFPKRVIGHSIMRTIFATILSIHLKLHFTLQKHFENGLENWLNNEIRSPALLFASKVDRIGTSEFLEQYAASWRANGVDVTTKVFEDSLHIKHYQTYPEEYIKYVHNHWEKTKLLERV